MKTLTNKSENNSLDLFDCYWVSLNIGNIG